MEKGVQLGEIKKGREIGKSSPSSWFMWSACKTCGKQRWVLIKKGIPTGILCRSCNAIRFHGKGDKHPGWKGGRVPDGKGYIKVRLYPGNFFYPMCDSTGYVAEHRLVVAKALGRNLHRWEIVHHKGVKYPKGSKENKQDNRYPENLQLVSDDRHKQITLLERRIKLLEGRVTLLEAENVQLEEEIKDAKRII